VSLPVTTGMTLREVNKQETGQQFFPDLAAALFPMNYAFGCNLSEFLGVEERQNLRVLDFALGSAVCSR